MRGKSVCLSSLVVDNKSNSLAFDQPIHGCVHFWLSLWHNWKMKWVIVSMGHSFYWFSQRIAVWNLCVFWIILKNTLFFCHICLLVSRTLSFVSCPPAALPHSHMTGTHASTHTPLHTHCTPPHTHTHHTRTHTHTHTHTSHTHITPHITHCDTQTHHTHTHHTQTHHTLWHTNTSHTHTHHTLWHTNTSHTHRADKCLYDMHIYIYIYIVVFSMFCG